MDLIKLKWFRPAAKGCEATLEDCVDRAQQAVHEAMRFRRKAQAHSVRLERLLRKIKNAQKPYNEDKVYEVGHVYQQHLRDVERLLCDLSDKVDEMSEALEMN